MNKNIRNIIVSIMALLIVGFSGCSADAKVDVLYNEDGSLTKHHEEVMMAEWCNYNEGRDFAKDNCE